MKDSGLADSPLFKRKTINSGLVSDADQNKLSQNHTVMKSSNYDNMVSTIYKSITEIGKEASTYRLSLNEKNELTRIIFSLRMCGLRISENEIVRIAINKLILEQTKKNGEGLLKRVLDLRIRKNRI